MIAIEMTRSFKDYVSILISVTLIIDIPCWFLITFVRRIHIYFIGCIYLGRRRIRLRLKINTGTHKTAPDE